MKHKANTKESVPPEIEFHRCKIPSKRRNIDEPTCQRCTKRCNTAEKSRKCEKSLMTTDSAFPSGVTGNNMQQESQILSNNGHYGVSLSATDFNSCETNVAKAHVVIHKREKNHYNQASISDGNKDD
eukprot:TRINITY_DN2686_c0_g1_i5.p1 TRINITY_DN2686_c0_g1~~TRINITY_DN2686_c0_g1_i5.p1  ORF type:complete len:127 (-),score=25.33 TRINITY_DN2686_c0_g1_i5:1763-2143(-)